MGYALNQLARAKFDWDPDTEMVVITGFLNPGDACYEIEISWEDADGLHMALLEFLCKYNDLPSVKNRKNRKA